MSRREQGAAWLERTLAAPALVQALAVAARLGIFEAVGDQPRSALLLAAMAGVHPEGLGRLLRALAAEGVLAPTEDGRYGPTPASALLCRGAPGAFREELLALAYRDWDGWGALLQAVETGRAAAPQPEGAWLEPPSAAAEALRREVGGSAPTVVFGSERFRAWVEAILPTGRPGGPLAIGGGLSQLDDREAAEALQEAHGGLTPGAQVMLVEPVRPADPRLDPALARCDLALLAFGRGRVRALDEWEGALERAGMRLEAVRAVRGRGGWAILVASRGLV
ncbi:hypothetical protein [Tepidiforma sp.]|uniref:methyltransferase family protein n=1 Tax=Tepidiforma sp. TaxID=2682230 RepID=UPI002ADE1985|nr:hypothetical protein [Tepidiforma sp.]